MISEKSTGLPRSVFAIGSTLALVALVWIGGGGHAAATLQASSDPLQASSDPRPTIVLVHGDWADASSWNKEIRRLQNRGFSVVAPPNTLRGPSQDAPYLASYLETIPGPIVLVAHSYGGFVATNAATGNPNVKALVYIDAFAPDENETALDLVGNTTSCVALDNAFKAVPISGGVDLYLNWEADPPYPGFRECFANGVAPKTAAVLFATQRPASAAQFSDPSGPPAWESIPSWALLGTRDNVIPPALQEEMYGRAGAQVSRARAGHLTPITRPGAVVRVILTAVEATT
jgi:pimeloyl-ACP methyl ester carboxylesterase